LHLCKTLTELGHDVTLLTFEHTNWKHVTDLTGVDLRNIIREIVIPLKTRTFGIYMKLFLSFYATRYVKKYDLVINTHGEVLPMPADITFIQSLSSRILGKISQEHRERYFRSILWKTYYEIYRNLDNRLLAYQISKGIILTNSRFCKYIIERTLKKKAIVVYPPCEVEKYVHASKLYKDDAILYIARFEKSKNHHVLIKSAKYLPDMMFYICGTVKGKSSFEYYNYCKNLIQRLNLRNVMLIPNLSENDKILLLSKCKIYTHLMPFEYFGIAPVEALASGCVLVVSKYSGTWIDVCLLGKFGVCFENLEPSHVAQKILEASKLKIDIEELRNHIMNFSVSTFRRRIVRLLSVFSRRS